MHFDNATLALEHDKLVLVEKAITMTGDEARELVAAAVDSLARRGSEITK